MKRVAAEGGDALPPDARELWKRRVGDLQKKGAGLPVEAAVKEWLSLFDAHASLTEQFGYVPEGRLLIAALPPPAAWDVLKKEVLARPTAKAKATVREIGLRMLVASLTSDRAAFEKEFSALEAAGETEDPRYGGQSAQLLYLLRQALIDRSDDPNQILNSLQEQLKWLQKNKMSYPMDFAVPDLATILGEERAAEVLRTALTAENVKLSVSEGDKTLELARKIALERVDALKSPQWALAASLDAGELYEALERRFPADISSQQDYDAREARVYYLVGLIARGETEKALAVAEKFPSEGGIAGPSLAALVKAGRGEQAFDFLDKLLSKNPDLPFWSFYIGLSAKVGATDKMLERVRAGVAVKTLSPERRNELDEALIDALLAADQVEEGLAVIRKALVAGEKGTGSPSEASKKRSELALRLAQLGLVLQKPALVEEGLAILRADGAAEKTAFDSSADQNDQQIAGILFAAGKNGAAEKVLADYLLSKVKQNKAAASGGYASPDGCQDALLSLAALYHQSGNYRDVLALMDQSPDWGVADLAAIYSRQTDALGSAKEDFPVGYLVAAALAKTGQAAAARPIIEATLTDRPGFDRGYELLLELAGPEAEAKLDALFAADPFEERPLIWKAKLLLDAKRLPEAEATIRKAIAIDPSDGEQGPNDRMRAYAILADILEARGDTKDVALYRNVVKAIRLSEKADRFYEAGLLSRAVKMYQESLTHFADAYCIQSRLARQLFNLGRMKEAEEHYRRAYELMPDSFGRVESHCFGCEQAFEGTQQQGIAETIFTDLSRKNPDKPQVFYLLGYLRDEQKRYDEALAHYRKAVALDPEYLNAWKRLLSASSHVRLPAAERDAIAVHLFKLNPKGRSASALREVSDPKMIWEAVASVGTPAQKPTALYPFKASQEFLAGKPANPYRLSFGREELTPGGAVAGQVTISALASLLGLH